MANSILSVFEFMGLLFLLSMFNKMQLSTSLSPLCHGEESSALLQFKQSFVLNKLASSHPSAYPKMASWNQHGETGDCCLWDGVECDERTGRVIVLNLSSSCLYGSIDSNSSLFQLVQLQTLSLADNNFNYSQIPSGFRHLSMLTNLDLSFSVFYGQIPLEISELTRLTSLDLTGSVDSSFGKYLQLRSPGLRRLVENLTSIQKLFLANVDISSEVPESIANLSSLRSLYLGNCGMFGLFPMQIFNLPNLKDLSVPVNENLTGYLPEFQWGSPFEILWLQGTNFSGQVPNSIGNLHSLTKLDIRESNFYGPLPYSLGNLTNLRILILMNNNFQGQIPSSLANLTQLILLSLSANNLTGGFMSWVGNQNKLALLNLGHCGLTGEISPSLGNLTQLRSLTLSWNHLTGRIPHWLANLTKLTLLNLGENELHGPIPDSISKLLNLEQLSLCFNHLSGILNLDMFFNLKNLTWLQVSGNSFSSLIETSLNATLPKWRLLELELCNLTKFPNFLRYQDKLERLELSGNNIHGPIPNWLWNTSRQTMSYLGLNFNSLTGFEQPSLVSSMSKLQFLYLQSNKLQGSVPIPPTSVVAYFVSNNSLTGEIPLMLCNLPDLHFLELAHNNLSGMLPQCLFNLGNSLSILNLGHNSLHGTIPETFKKGSKLKMIDLSHNKLQGKIPKSLANQITLESLNLEDNKIVDKFPSWLGTLPNLKVLILKSNKLSGPIGRPTTGFDFSMLRIINLAYNGFTGAVPSNFFQNWNSMRTFDTDKLLYMNEMTTVWSYGYKMTYESPISYFYQLRMINKGVDIEYMKIPNILATIDFSCNKFEGDIPESIFTLKKLHSLNLSNNHLSGKIPSQIANLTDLESLDFSSNVLTGVIPQQMVYLTFLSVLNVSHNQLVGPIPQGKQFGTYENSSYKDNLGLCGKPLSNICGNAPPVPTAEDDQGSDSLGYIYWMVVLIGYGSGLMVGVVIGLWFTTWRHDWIMKTFGRRQPKRRSHKKRGGRV